jgi:hypothetical protein
MTTSMAAMMLPGVLSPIVEREMAAVGAIASVQKELP